MMLDVRRECEAGERSDPASHELTHHPSLFINRERQISPMMLPHMIKEVTAI